MALEILRKEICDQTASKKFPQNNEVSRVFYVLCNSSMGYLKEWYNNWFPIIDDDLKKIYPWFICELINNKKDEIEGKISEIWFNAFDIGTYNKLTSKGYRIIDSANQIIFVGDISEEKFIDNIDAAYNNFQTVINKLSTPPSRLYRIGAFIIRSIQNNEKGENRSIRFPSELDKFWKWSKEKLDRVFIVDLSNSQGTIISNSTDLHFLLGHIIYSLTNKPTEFAQEHRSNNFGEWIRREKIEDGCITGFSGISILNPIDQILETALVKKGSDILQEAFFGEYQDGKKEQHVLLFLNGQHLNSIEVFKRFISNNPQLPLIYPFQFSKNEKSGIPPNWDFNNPEPFRDHIDNLDAKLPGYADQNEKIINAIGKNILEDFKHNLSEHLNFIMANEKGGVIISQEFLAELCKQIQKIIPNEPPSPVYPDTGVLIKNLEEKSKTSPRKESVILRTLLLSIPPILGVIYGIITSSTLLLFSIIFTLGTIFSGLIYWFAWKSKMERRVIKIWQAINEKWAKLMDYKITTATREILPMYVSHINEMASTIDDISKRLDEIVKYAREKHTPPAPIGSAFWIYSFATRKEMEKYGDLINMDASRVALDFILDEKPLEFWERLSKSGTDDLNKWEWNLIEKSALKLIPFSTHITDLSICQVLRESKDKLSNFLELLKRTVSPFLVLKPGNYLDDIRPTLEIPLASSDDIYSEIETAIRGNVQSIERKDSKTIYRISLLSFSEGVKNDSLNVT